MNETVDTTTVTEDTIPVFVMGRRFEVPSSLTIQKALEHAGFQLVRGCGCRGGICGACATVFRKPDNHRVEVGLACQTVVEPNMYLSQIPFFPANRAEYRLEQIEATPGTLAELYPELFKCIGCNTCTRSCPMDIDVMGYMAKAMRGDITAVAEESLACVMCGICTARCPAEEVQYNIAILCRRLYGKYIAPHSDHLDTQVSDIGHGAYEERMQQLMAMSEDQLKDLYRAREIEPEAAPEDWTPTASH